MSFISRHTVVYGILKYIKNVVQVEAILQMKAVMMPFLMQAIAVHPARIMSGKSLGFQCERHMCAIRAPI